MQVYKEFSILSSRPRLNEMKKIKHHLYGFVSVKKYFSAGDWLKEVKKKVSLCIKNNKIPIIVGGTGLYFNTITKGISKIPDIDNKTRKKLETFSKSLDIKDSQKIINNRSERNKIMATDLNDVKELMK